MLKAKPSTPLSIGLLSILLSNVKMRIYFVLVLAGRLYSTKRMEKEKGYTLQRTLYLP